MSEKIKHKSKEQRNLFERILESVPGFRSYLSKERSRESDKKEREYISRKLTENISSLRDLSRDMTSGGSFELLDELERVEKRLRRVADRIKHADYGYSGFFDNIKVEDPELKKLYEFDVALIETAENIKKSIDSLDDLVSEPDKLEQRIRDLQDWLQQVDRDWSKREDLITGKDGKDREGS